MPRTSPACPPPYRLFGSLLLTITGNAEGILDCCDLTNSESANPLEGPGGMLLRENFAFAGDTFDFNGHREKAYNFCPIFLVLTERYIY